MHLFDDMSPPELVFVCGELAPETPLTRRFRPDGPRCATPTMRESRRTPMKKGPMKKGAPGTPDAPRSRPARGDQKPILAFTP